MTTNTNQHFLQNNLIVWLCAMLCCAFWGSAFPGIKIGYRLFEISGSDTATVILFAGCRFTLAGFLTIFLGSLLSKKVLLPKRTSWNKILCLCMLQTVLQYLFFYIGLANTSGVKASIINAVNVFVSLLVSCLLFHQETLSSQKILGCIIGFAGVVLINMSGMNFELSLTGEGFIFLSTVAYAFSSVYLKKFSSSENPVILSGYQFMIGGLIMIFAGFFMGGKISVISWGGILLLIYLALVSAIAYTLWGLLLKYNPVSKIAVFGFMTPVFGVILSAIFLGETAQATGLVSLISLILVCVGITIVNRKK